MTALRNHSTKLPIGASVFVCVFPPMDSLAGFGARYESPAWWAACVLAALVFLVTSVSWRERMGYGLAMVAFLSIGGWKAFYYFPMQHRVEGMMFVDAPLTDVLQSMSQRRRSMPYRRFVICDEETQDARLNVTIPDGTTLGESMRLIAEAAGCEHDRNWWSWCGNSYQPTHVLVYFHATGQERTKGVWEIDRDRLWLRDKNGVLLCDPNGVRLEDADSRRAASWD